MELFLALIFALLASALVMAETALGVTSRARAERMVEEGLRGADRVRTIASDPAPAINAVMVTRMGLETASIVLVALVTFQHLTTDWFKVVLTVAIMSTVSFILWGVGPRTLGRQHPERTLQFFAPLVSFLTLALGWLAKGMVVLGNAITPGRGFAEGPFASEVELRDLVDAAEAENLIEASESKMIHSVFELGETLVKEVMVPRTSMVWVASDRSLRAVLSVALRSGFSRIPVVGEDGLDDIQGVIYLKDVTRRVFDYPDAQKVETAADLMRPVTFVPETKLASDLLKDMQSRHSHLVIVVDEFGGTAGLATMEDIVEEIVGEIVDEYDRDAPTHVQVGEDTWRVASRMELDELSELLDIKIDDEDVETVGGLMSKLLNQVPIPGSTVVHEGVEFVADQTVGRRHQVATVLVRLLSDEERAALEEQETVHD